MFNKEVGEHKMNNKTTIIFFRQGCFSILTFVCADSKFLQKFELSI